MVVVVAGTVVVVVGSRAVVVVDEMVVVVDEMVVAVSSGEPQATSASDNAIALSHDECRLNGSPCSRKAQRTVLRGGSGGSIAFEVWRPLLGERSQRLHEIVGEQVSGIPARDVFESVGCRFAIVGRENRLDPLHDER